MRVSIGNWNGNGRRKGNVNRHTLPNRPRKPILKPPIPHPSTPAQLLLRRIRSHGYDLTTGGNDTLGSGEVWEEVGCVGVCCVEDCGAGDGAAGGGEGPAAWVA